MKEVIECVPNFSEGRDKEIIKRIIAVVESVARVLDVHIDRAHNRSVVTFISAPESVVEAAVRAAGVARDVIDLRVHSGAHPRVGAMDVLPFVPLEGVTMDECVRLAHEAGGRIAREVGVPVYFYGAAARKAERVKLEDVRRGGFERLRDEAVSNPNRAPDIKVEGVNGLHKSAGAVLIGARKFLIAYNINLRTRDVEIARCIARSIRTSGGGLAAVKALGLELREHGWVQVSMNLVDYEVTSIARAFDAVRDLADEAGVEIIESEIVGLVPRLALDETADYFPTIKGFHRGMILENKLSG
ncbi:MAG: glutamate formimidoyltransferase [Pyrinomonadaceae bacterium MAG19_C2-C3]|nr:glutamate formimidoyltransferase [Pyrinomonadaceae bacterium MAG19_C2-C3]